MGLKERIFSAVLLSFLTGGMFGFSSLSSLNNALESSETGTILGSVKVYRARHSGDVLVFLEGASLKKDYSAPAKHSVLDQKNLVFVPRVLPILKGTTVDFLNSDNVQHNVFSPGKAEKFNLGTWGLGGMKNYTFNKPGEVVILCNVHSEMVAYIIILENPYFAKTAEDGSFRIENVPPGTYTVKTWQEKMKSEPLQITLARGESKEIQLELKSRK